MNNKKVLLKRREEFERENQIKVFFFNYRQSFISNMMSFIAHLCYVEGN